MPVATNGSIELHYEDTGAGDPIVFSHGFLLDHEMFDEQVADLSRDHRCITWDQRGHGATDAAGAFTFWDSADDLVAVMDACELETAVLVGMSQGGFISLRAALRAPERVKGLFLIDTQAGKEDPNTVPMYRGMVEMWQTGQTEELASTVASIIIGGDDTAKWTARWMDEPPNRILEPFETLLGREDIHDRLAEITQPAAVVHGAMDVAIPLERAEALSSGLPNAAPVQVIEGGGHASNMTNPAEVNEAIRAFLATL